MVRKSADFNQIIYKTCVLLACSYCYCCFPLGVSQRLFIFEICAAYRALFLCQRPALYDFFIIYHHYYFQGKPVLSSNKQILHEQTKTINIVYLSGFSECQRHSSQIGRSLSSYLSFVSVSVCLLLEKGVYPKNAGIYCVV